MPKTKEEIFTKERRKRFIELAQEAFDKSGGMGYSQRMQFELMKLITVLIAEEYGINIEKEIPNLVKDV